MPPIFTNLAGSAPLLTAGGVGILKTDTLHGIVARADSEAAVERVFMLKTRTPTKSPIVLISSVDQLFDTYDTTTLAFLNDYWPGPYSIILPSTNAPAWLTRGNNSVAYRLPDDEALRSLIATTGPLIAPSANPETLQPAATIREAQEYFGKSVDFYVDSGEVAIDAPPSRLLRYDIHSGDFERLR